MFKSPVLDHAAFKWSRRLFFSITFSCCVSVQSADRPAPQFFVNRGRGWVMTRRLNSIVEGFSNSNQMMINCIYICFKWSRTCEVQIQHTFTFIIRLFFLFFFSWLSILEAAAEIEFWRVELLVGCENIYRSSYAVVRGFSDVWWDVGARGKLCFCFLSFFLGVKMFSPPPPPPFFFPSVSQNTDVTPEALNHMQSPGKTNPGENITKHDVRCDEFCLQKLRKLPRNNVKLHLIPVSGLQYLKFRLSNYNKRKQLIFSAEWRRNSRAPVWRVSSFSDGAD